ncbi:extended SDR family protein [Candidatus Nanopelagicus abundans]|jgi:nucleoside-diphosphate-sugar epimerase|uniref:Extended SDR family protein n=1 Tax=Candidatus Nanopelagicus abundans TaxID=1884916 RepID=A0A249L5T1_9ACTN|nr:SDR family oxidoreductase [Candidatus Nanopelagicus abundans]ASY24336.1 extended SDR family protein [Candidatus Nanopelagicus abundans]
MRKRVVVTGGSGYIGSVLSQLLVESGYRVRILDRFFFGDTIPDNEYIEKIKVDSRTFSSELLEDTYAVLDLAAISNDPAGELDRIKTIDINYRARRRLQELASESKVERYILASSCSVYGFQDGILEETSPVNPLTTYAEANIYAEESAINLLNRGTDMGITIFRQATMYGLSPRMRFDLAINGMTLGLWEGGNIPILRDGNQWRPMIHIRDTSKAFIAALVADKDLVQGQLFNVGSNEQNYQIIQSAKLVAQGLNKPFNFEWYGEPDHRSYQVNFDKIRKVLDFAPDWTADRGAAEIAVALERGIVKADQVTKTVAWYSTLLEWESRLKDLAPDGFVL